MPLGIGRLSAHGQWVQQRCLPEMQSSRIGALEAALAQVKQLLLQQQGQGAGQCGVPAPPCHCASAGLDCCAFKQCWLLSCAAVPVLPVSSHSIVDPACLHGIAVPHILPRMPGTYSWQPDWPADS